MKKSPILAAVAVAALAVAAASCSKPAEKAPAAEAAKPIGSVLVFHATKGFVHPSIVDGVAAIKALGAANGFTVDDTADPAAFTAENLGKYKAVVFLSTTGDVLPDAAQRTAFENYIKAGGGYLGIHAAADMGTVKESWPWYRDLVGGAFKGHTLAKIFTDQPLTGPLANLPPNVAVVGGKLADAPADADATAAMPGIKTTSWEPAKMKIEDQSSPMVAGWGPEVTRSDEWYGFLENPRPKVHVIASVDESTYNPAGGKMGDHPIVWCHDYDGGRAVYTGLGHPKASWADKQMQDHILAGIKLAAGAEPFNCKVG
ncbi:MAG: hypothetical protein BGN86_15910 [Caulobacterales bacterium 68-7]|nr:ThuA domain-containing protein [Caulobacterales bacterium]OJU13173.1 MAG: hypothetical protein BGN86_15910 [Caulobacterales bacterium 68-7]